MKKFFLLCLLVFGINTAMEAQTKLVFTDESGNVMESLEFERTLTKDEIGDLFNDLRTSSTSNGKVAGSFRLDVWWQYYPDHWSHEYGGPFFWYEGETFLDIINRIRAEYDI